ncbi:spike base protein, RCAP_Rcc01079 family [Ancylobacter sp.]|uniref:spike base protein, RCAP_Rcc01079 family n=1 Tax=Ancylobacter sp. TaxID=1872567 RepID=UPI003D0B80D1
MSITPPIVQNEVGQAVAAPPFYDVVSAPASKWVKVTKADSNLAGGICRALLVGTEGTANLQDADGVTTTDVPLQIGYNPLRCLQVRTGGTADNIWALY